MGVRPFRCSSCDKSDQNKSNLETYKKRALLKWNKIDKCFFGPIIKRQGGLTKDSSSSDSPRITPANVERTKPIPAGLWCQLAVGRYGKKRQLMRSLSSAVSLPPETVVVPTLPDQPFFHKDNMIVPFPMFLDKSVDNVSHTEEIFSLPGPEFKLPSVTQILRDTMPKESEVFLNVWRKRKIAEIGEEGFKTYMRGNWIHATPILDCIYRVLLSQQDALSVGKLLHASIETRLRGVSYDAVHVEPRVSGHWLSLKSILSNVDEVRVLESCVVHQHLKYKGFVDCVARYKSAARFFKNSFPSTMKTEMSFPKQGPVGGDRMEDIPESQEYVAASLRWSHSDCCVRRSNQRRQQLPIWGNAMVSCLFANESTTFLGSIAKFAKALSKRL